MKRGKRYSEAATKVDSSKKYSVNEALKLAIDTNIARFDATIDVAFRLNLDPRHAEQNLRGAIVLPHGTGKTRKVLVIAKGEKAKEAEAAGADFVGDQDMIDKIQNDNWFEFDVIVATPDMMGALGKLGRLLGPKGLMPNPKTGTVTMDVTKAVQEIQAGKVEYRVDKVGNIHVAIGKASFGPDKLEDNLNAIYDLLTKTKPATVKGVYFKNVSVCSTMGPGVKVDVESLKA